MFKEGDPVLLVYDRRRRWLKKVAKSQFHCNYGTVNLENLIGAPYGSEIKTSKNKTLRAYPPSIIDWINAFEHQSQIIYEKDAAMILMLLDLKPGDIVYEAGTGSGSLTAILARSVGREGKVVTHDNREQAIKVAKRNLAKLELDNVEFNFRNVAEEGFAPGACNSLVLDMGDPWRVIENVTQVLKPGGRIVIFLPTFDQLDRTSKSLYEHNFFDIRARELIEREIQLKPGAIRPATRMIGHTGFLISAIFLGTSPTSS